MEGEIKMFKGPIRKASYIGPVWSQLGEKEVHSLQSNPKGDREDQFHEGDEPVTMMILSCLYLYLCYLQILLEMCEFKSFTLYYTIFSEYAFSSYSTICVITGKCKCVMS